MSAPYTIRVGQVLTDYSNIQLTVQRVAAGGMGVVAMGPDRMHNDQWFSLKTVQPAALARNPTLQDRFLREALTWLGLWPHPNILQAQFATQIDGLIFLALDYAEHGSLADLLARGSLPLPLPLALEIAQQIAAGLVALHTPDPAHLRPLPIVHRDLKPANILLKQANKVPFIQIADFGLVALLPEAAGGLGEDQVADPTRSARFQTRAGIVLGTPAYMAPEQWQGATLAGTPADLYALGLILAELVTGQHPLRDLRQRQTVGAWRQAHVQGEPARLQARVPAVPVPLERLYQALLSKRAEDRPTAEEALARLQAVAQRLGEAPYAPPEVVAHTPEHELGFWHNWAAGYQRFQLYPEALARNDAALRLDPERPEVLITRGAILSGLQRLGAAEVAYQQALAHLAPEDRRRSQAVYFNLGNLYSDQAAYDKAEAAYQAALALLPDSATTWYNRANNERAWGQAEWSEDRQTEGQMHLERAREYAIKALALSPNATNAQRLLAAIERGLNTQIRSNTT